MGFGWSAYWLLAHYGQDEVQSLALPKAVREGPGFEGQYLMIHRPVTLDQKQIGTLHLRYDYRAGQREIIVPFLIIMGGIVLAAIVPAILLSTALQRVISEPVLRLAATAKLVADKQDYSVRAEHRRRDELGILTGAFNQMLTRIQTDAAALRQVNAALEAEITERTRAEVALRESEERFRSLFENASIGLYRTTPEGRILMANPTLVRMLGYASFDELATRNVSETGYADPHDRNLFLERIETNGEVIGMEAAWFRRDGSQIFVRESAKVLHHGNGEASYYEGTVEDITARKKAEAELEALHRQLLDTSRQAGMAEVATGVLHNVGNVLNSINVSSNLLIDRLRRSKAANLGKVATLLQEHRVDLADFLARDPKGQQLPAYLGALSHHLCEEQTFMLEELNSLRSHLDHIKEIVAMQQNYARVSGVVEMVEVSRLVEDALQLNAEALARHGIRVQKEFAEVPPIFVEKHKVLQILVNLIRNAKYAMDEGRPADKLLTLGIGLNKNSRVEVRVTDNGLGIPPENLTRIFSHGFTTKKDGHGFGLHSGALAARELGGSLHAYSEGLGKGATFVLELPSRPLKGER